MYAYVCEYAYVCICIYIYVYCSIVGKYIMVVIALASISLVCTVIVLSFHHHSPTKRPPKWLRIVANDYLAWILCMQNGIKESQGNGLKKPNKGFSQLVPSKIKNMFRRKDNSDNSGPDNEDFELPTLSAQDDNKITLEEPNSSDYMHQAMFKLVNLTTSLVDKINDDNESADIQLEWSTLGLILDRFFLIIFFIITMLVTISLLGFYPLSGPSQVEPVRVT